MSKGQHCNLQRILLPPFHLCITMRDLCSASMQLRSRGCLERRPGPTFLSSLTFFSLKSKQSEERPHPQASLIRSLFLESRHLQGSRRHPSKSDSDSSHSTPSFGYFMSGNYCSINTGSTNFLFLPLLTICYYIPGGVGYACACAGLDNKMM